MDRQNRLTKWSELDIGARYQWLKGGVGGSIFTLVEINERDGFIRMLKENNKIPMVFRQSWKNRFRKVA